MWATIKREAPEVWEAFRKLAAHELGTGGGALLAAKYQALVESDQRMAEWEKRRLCRHAWPLQPCER